jgi:AcrR family transcriptional regulator
MELFRERGFDGTAVADIAERAGLTERTFFRYFADKREVLFGGAGALEGFLVERVEAGPPSLSPLEVVCAALSDAATAFFEDRRLFVRTRQAVIDANAELRERELIKLASLASSLADALRRRGVTDPTASLAAETGIAVLKTAFSAWMNDDSNASLSRFLEECADELRTMTDRRKRAVRR